MPVTVTLTFNSKRDKQKLMQHLCDVIGPQLDMRLEWHGDFQHANSFRVKRGVIPEEDDGHEFGAGIFDEDEELAKLLKEDT